MGHFHRIRLMTNTIRIRVKAMATTVVGYSYPQFVLDRHATRLKSKPLFNNLCQHRSDDVVCEHITFRFYGNQSILVVSYLLQNDISFP